MPHLKKKIKITRETEATKQDATRVFRAACIIDGAYIQKVCKLALCKFSDLDRGQVLQMSCIMLGDAICRVEKCFCSIETFFFSCVFSLFSSVPPAFSAIPSPSSLSLLSLSLISDPFFMHYSITLNSHLQCITSSHLSQTHFILPSPSFSHFASLPPSLPRSPPVRYNTFLYVSPSPPFYYLFVFSPVTSSHANLTRFFPPLIFTSHLVCHSVYIPAACLRWCHPSFLIDYSKHVMYFGT